MFECYFLLFFVFFKKLQFFAIVWSLNLCLGSMCRAKYSLLHSISRAKSSLLYYLCEAANMLRTWYMASYFDLHMKKSKQTFLFKWNGDIFSWTKRTTNVASIVISDKFVWPHIFTNYIFYFLTWLMLPLWRMKIILRRLHYIFID